MNYKSIILATLAVLNFTACSTNANSDCASCTAKLSDSIAPDKKAMLELKSDISKPLTLASSSALVITKSEVGRGPAGENPTTGPGSHEDLQDLYCRKFSLIEVNFVATTIKEMEATPYPIDSYFQTAACQPGEYGRDVKSPIFHIIADDPTKRENFLNILWLYYTKKRNDPAKFIEAVNFKNTKGETLLDYIESRSKDKNYKEIFKESLTKIIAMACSHGAEYSAYPDKKCP